MARRPLALRRRPAWRWLSMLTGIGVAASLATAVSTGPATAAGLPSAQAATAGAGTDQGCPATTPEAASAAAPSAPTHVQVVAAAGSATVRWCAPDRGAGQVVSYTVTSSDGQQVTAQVPNQWAIVDGLRNGTSYQFRVVANTPAVSSPAAASPSVTPEPVAAPSHVVLGASHPVTYDSYSLMIGGKRTVIYAGEFDPFRTPSPSLWLDRLQKMKADGYNAVTAYFDWEYHSPAPGVYDFTGVRDINEFLNLAQQVGLYVIARPGPYINAETDGGGIPAWVLTLPGGFRTDSQPYLSAALQWYSQVDPIIAAHQITRGGDVILYQVENELRSDSTSVQNYMAALEARARADGIDVPLTYNQCCGGPYFSSGTGAVDISGPDVYSLGLSCSNPAKFGNPGGYQTPAGEPPLIPEFQGGSYDRWGGEGFSDCYQMTGPAFENVYYKNNFAQGITIQSNYMGVGGTNWGWLPDPRFYSSYDYGAGIGETGEIGAPANPNDIAGSKYGQNKLIGDFVQSVAPLAKTVPVASPATDNPAVTTLARANPDDGTQLIYLRQSDATSTSTAGTHLALDAGSTTGYTYDDADPNLQYSGTWTHAAASDSYTSGDYQHTESWSTQAGDSVSVRFTGTAVRWIGPRNPNGGIADVYIDGTKVATIDTYAAGSKQFQQVLFDKSGLADGPHTLKIVVTGTRNLASSAATVVVDAIDTPSAADEANYYPTVPQQPGTAITLQGRDARLLLANYTFGGEHLVYSTSQLMTQASIGGRTTALLYGPAGTDGETVLRYASQPKVDVLGGNVTTTWDATRGDLRLDYSHSGIDRVLITGGGRPPLLLLLTTQDAAQTFWPEDTSAGAALAEGGYLVRDAQISGDTLALTGDTSAPGPLTVWAPADVGKVSWNGQPITVTRQADGSLSGQVPGPAPVTLPALDGWRFQYGTPEAQPGFDDSAWTLADHPVTTNSTAPAHGPVLYADDYGFHHGFVWYRGHFTATGDEHGITVTADGIAPTGAYSVWLNGLFLGSSGSGGAQTKTFGFPAAALRPGADNVVAVLVEISGHQEGPIAEPAGLYSATLVGSAAPLTWRLQGNAGGTQLQDPARGPLNPAGLYGSNHGWDLPGYPDGNWARVSLPDDWAARGAPAGVGWYRTSLNLNLPTAGYVPIGLKIGPSAQPANYRALVYVNGWLAGRYDNTLGPQSTFYLPAGVLDEHGHNTIAIAVWKLDGGSGGLGAVSLVAEGNQAGGLTVDKVTSPGYDAAGYGPPEAPAPTLAAAASRDLITAGQPFTVKATLANPSPSPLQAATVRLDAPDGWTVSPASPASIGTVPHGGQASASFTVTAPASASGSNELVATASYDQPPGGTQHRLAAATVTLPAGSLADTFNNVGITDDSNTNAGDIDGAGSSLSGQALAAAGVTPGSTVHHGGVDFTWPSAAPGQPDNTVAGGQAVRLSGSGSTLGFLITSTYGPASGDGQIVYADGSSQPFTLTAPDWYSSPPSGSDVAITMTYRNRANNVQQKHPISIYFQGVPLQAGKQVAYVILPNVSSTASSGSPALHVFAMNVGG